ncbi:MAG: adenylate/guanylate cyclase domain-containing protein [Phycisphaeraceae bacterium]|nr:adenylate/guanylate cyclase domain-containing protein [Phycisphaeraceae bacterium]
MGFTNDLKSEVTSIINSEFVRRQGRKVPETVDLTLGNEAVDIDGAVLYADLVASTALVDSQNDRFAAKVYKMYLVAASRIIRAESGEITAFDGDRVMAVFVDDSKCTRAARAALRINHAVREIINPAIKAKYSGTDFELRQVVGIDAGPLMVVKTGIRQYNDLVWIGRPANYAAKLCAMREGGFSSWMTKAVYDGMNDSTRISAGRPMWEPVPWAGMKGAVIYRSNWHWGID